MIIWSLTECPCSKLTTALLLLRLMILSFQWLVGIRACFIEDSGVSVKTVFSSRAALYRSLFVTPSEEISHLRLLNFKRRYVLWTYLRLKIAQVANTFIVLSLLYNTGQHGPLWEIRFVALWLYGWLWDEAFFHCPTAGESNTLCMYHPPVWVKSKFKTRK